MKDDSFRMSICSATLLYTLIQTVQAATPSSPALSVKAQKLNEAVWIAAASRKAREPGHEQDWARFALGLDLAKQHPNWSKEKVLEVTNRTFTMVPGADNPKLVELAQDGMDILPWNGGKVLKWTMYLSKYSDDFAKDATGFPTPVPLPHDGADLNIWKDYYETAKSDKRFGDVVDALSSHFNGTTTKTDADTVFSMYPGLKGDTVSDSLSEALSNQQMDVTHIRQVSDEILKHQGDDYKKLSRTLDDQNKKITDLSTFVASRLTPTAAQSRRQQILDNAGLTQDAVTCATSLALIFGDAKTKQVAAQFNKGASAAIKIGENVALFASGLGSVGAAAGMLEGSASLASLFGPQESPDAAVMQQLQQISKQLAQLTDEMRASFVALNERLDNVFSVLNKTYVLLSQVNQNVDILRAYAYAQEGEMQNLQITLDRSFRDLKNYEGKKDVEACFSDVHRGASKFTEATFSTEYSLCNGKWLNFSTDLSAESSNSDKNSDLDVIFAGPIEEDIANAINFANTAYGAGTVSGGRSNAWDPYIWSAGVNGYLQFASTFRYRFPNEFSSTWRVDVDRLSTPGINLHRSLTNLLGPDAKSRNDVLGLLFSEYETQLKVVSHEVERITKRTYEDLATATDLTSVPPLALPSEIDICPGYVGTPLESGASFFVLPAGMLFFTIPPDTLKTPSPLTHGAVINGGGVLRLPSENAAAAFGDGSPDFVNRIRVIETFPPPSTNPHLLEPIKMCAIKSEVAGSWFSNNWTERTEVQVSVGDSVVGTGVLNTDAHTGRQAPSDQIRAWLVDPAWIAAMEQTIVATMPTHEEFRWIALEAIHDELALAGTLTKPVTKLDGLKKALTTYMQLAMPETYDQDAVRVLLSGRAGVALPDKAAIEEMFGCAASDCAAGAFAPSSSVAISAVKTSPAEVLMAPVKAWKDTASPLIAIAPWDQRRRLIETTLSELCSYGMAQEALTRSKSSKDSDIAACTYRRAANN
jgi:hypothetical protein